MAGVWNDRILLLGGRLLCFLPIESNLKLRNDLSRFFFVGLILLDVTSVIGNGCFNIAEFYVRPCNIINNVWVRQNIVGSLEFANANFIVAIADRSHALSKVDTSFRASVTPRGARQKAQGENRTACYATNEALSHDSPPCSRPVCPTT